MLAAAHHAMHRQSARNPRAYATTPSAVSAATRDLITSDEAASPRSTTGASVVLKPKARTARATKLSMFPRHTSWVPQSRL